mmetsp:Transcript_39817/g.106273  ORF Transcript_39817/g.106273 Transcript_39817/m.106273 type:complete len:116 (+) Transcript_39817:529-876(+)
MMITFFLHLTVQYAFSCVLCACLLSNTSIIFGAAWWPAGAAKVAHGSDAASRAFSVWQRQAFQSGKAGAARGAAPRALQDLSLLNLRREVESTNKCVEDSAFQLNKGPQSATTFF